MADERTTYKDDGAAPHSELIGATRAESRRLMDAWWQELTAAAESGRAEMIVTWPLTRGSSRKLRPVICDTALTTA